MITLDALDRDILAAYAAGTPMADLCRQWQRRQRVVRVVYLAARLDPHQAARLVHLFDSLAARPVAELSPIHRPARVMAERHIQGPAPAWPVLNRKEHSTP